MVCGEWCARGMVCGEWRAGNSTRGMARGDWRAENGARGMARGAWRAGNNVRGKGPDSRLRGYGGNTREFVRVRIKFARTCDKHTRISERVRKNMQEFTRVRKKL